MNADLTPRDSAAPASTGALRPFPIARAAFPVLSLRETVWPSGDFFLQRALRSSSLKIVVKVSLGSLGGREARRRVGAAQARVGTRVRLSCDHSSTSAELITGQVSDLAVERWPTILLQKEFCSWENRWLGFTNLDTNHLVPDSVTSAISRPEGQESV